MSRWKRSLTGALITFAIAFPVGATSAGYLTDRNNPGAALGAGVGTSIGLFGAAMGAPLGALSGKRVDKVHYEARGQQ